MPIGADGTVAELDLPQLAERGHGSWYFDCAVPVLPGRRERLRRGGYLTRREAIAARDALLGDGDTATAEGWTMQRWLRYWLTTRSSILLTADTYTSVLTDLFAYAAEATAKRVLAAAARNPGHRHRRSDHLANPLGRARRFLGTSRDQAFRSSQGVEAGPPTYVPPTSHKDQSRIVGWLYGLVNLVRRVELEPTTSRTKSPLMSMSAIAVSCHPHQLMPFWLRLPSFRCAN